MTTLANQLRSAFFLASRDAYVKGAFVLPALLAVSTILLVLLFPDANMHVMFESGLLGIVRTGALFGTCLAMAGIVTHDVSSGGLRAAVLAERGRGGYVASRVILALVLAVLLGVWSVLLGMAPLLGPRVVFEGMPAGELALRVAAHVLVGWTYAVFGMLLLWLARSPRGFASAFFAAVILGAGVLNALLLVPVAVLIPLSQELAYGALQIIIPILPSGLLADAFVADARLVVLPVAYVIVFWALSRRVMARAPL